MGRSPVRWRTVSSDSCRSAVGRWAGFFVSLAGLWAGGCANGPRYVPIDERVVIDRNQVEYPNDLQLTPFVNNLTAPVAVGFEETDQRYLGSVVVAGALVT